MPTPPILELERRSISSFLRDLAENPGRIADLPDAILSIENWSETVESRIDAIARASVRQITRTERRRPHWPRLRDVLRLCADIVDDHSMRLAERLETLSDFVDDKLAEERDFAAEEIKKKKHVPEILTLLAERGQTARGDLLEHFGLTDPNLTRILNAMESARLIDRIDVGREKYIRLVEQLQTDDRARSSAHGHVPAIARSLIRRVKVTACEDATPASYPLQFAHEKGLTDAFKLDFSRHQVEPGADPVKELGRIYSEKADFEARSIVLHRWQRRELSDAVRDASLDVYLLGADVGAGIFASPKHVQHGWLVDGDGSANRIIQFFDFCKSQDRLLVRAPSSDPAAQHFARAFIGTIYPRRMDKFEFQRSNITAQAWCKPIRLSEVETLYSPYWAESGGARMQILSFRDLETAHTEKLDAFVRNAAFKTQINHLLGMDLSTLVTHWSMTASIPYAAWRGGDPLACEIASRLYWFSAMVALLIKNNLDEYSAFVADRLTAHLGDESCFGTVQATSVYNCLKDGLRIPEAGEYFKPSAWGRTPYYYPENSASGDGVVSTAMQVHMTEAGRHVAEETKAQLAEVVKQTPVPPRRRFFQAKGSAPEKAAALRILAKT